MGFGVGELYTDRYFGSDAKVRVESLVKNIETVLRTRIARLDWMTSATKRKPRKSLLRTHLPPGGERFPSACAV